MLVTCWLRVGLRGLYLGMHYVMQVCGPALGAGWVGGITWRCVLAEVNFLLLKENPRLHSHRPTTVEYHNPTAWPVESSKPETWIFFSSPFSLAPDH